MDQHPNRGHQRMFAAPKYKPRELDDRLADAERQADAGGHNSDAQQKPPSAEATLLQGGAILQTHHPANVKRRPSQFMTERRIIRTNAQVEP